MHSQHVHKQFNLYLNMCAYISDIHSCHWQPLHKHQYHRETWYHMVTTPISCHITFLHNIPGNIPQNLLLYLLLLLMAKNVTLYYKCGWKNFHINTSPLQHVSTETVCIVNIPQTLFKNTFLLNGRGCCTVTLS